MARPTRMRPARVGQHRRAALESPVTMKTLPRGGYVSSPGHRSSATARPPILSPALLRLVAALFACSVLLPGALAASADDGGAVSGSVFVDADGDGVRSPDEAG